MVSGAAVCLTTFHLLVLSGSYKTYSRQTFSFNYQLYWDKYSNDFYNGEGFILCCTLPYCECKKPKLNQALINPSVTASRDVLGQVALFNKYRNRGVHFNGYVEHDNLAKHTQTASLMTKKIKMAARIKAPNKGFTVAVRGIEAELEAMEKELNLLPVSLILDCDDVDTDDIV